MKRFVLIGAVVLLAILLVAAILPLTVDSRSFRPLLQTQLQQRLHRQVSLGETSFSLFPLGLRVDQVSIGEAPGFPGGRPFASAREARVSIGFFALLRREVAIDSLKLRQPVIELIRNRQGGWNYETLGGASSGADTGASLSFRSLEIEDGQVAITDYRAGSPRAVYHHIDLGLYDFAPKRPFRVNLALRLPGAGDQSVAIEGRGTPRPGAGVDFDGKLRLKQASLGALAKVSGQPASLPVEAIATGETTVRSQHPAVEMEGNLTLAQLQVRGKPFSQSLSVDYRVKGDLAQRRFDLSALNLEMGGLKMAAAGRIDAGAAPHVDLQVNSRNAPLRDLAQVVYAFGAPRADFDVNGVLTAALHVRGAPGRPSLQGQAEARDLTVRASGWKQPVRLSSLVLEATPDAIRAREFQAEAGGTRLAASFTVNGYTRRDATLEAVIRAPQAKVDELLNIAASLGAVSPDTVQGTGSATLDVRLEGPLSGPLAAAGSASLTQASLQVPALRPPLKVGSAQLRFDRDSARLEIGSASVGSTTLRGDATLRGFTNPRLDFRASIDRLSTAEAQQWTAGTSPAGATKEPSNLSGSGSLSIGRLEVNQIVLQDVQATCTLDRGLVRLDPFTAQVYGGRQSGALSVDLRPANPVYAVRSRLEGVDANQFVSALTSWKGALQGRLRADTDVQLAPESGGAPARSLNGTASFSMENGKLTGVNLLNEVASLGKFLNFGRQAAAGTEIVSMSGSLKIQHGVAQTDDLRLNLGNAALAAAGTLNLVDQSVNMRLTSTLDRNFTDQVGGSKIGGWLTTAVSNQKGELVIPARVSGAYPNLRFLPDAERVAEFKLRGIVPSVHDETAKPSASGAAPAGPGSGPGASGTSPLQGIFDRLKSRQKKSDNPPSR